jgi:hypothetical protein
MTISSTMSVYLDGALAPAICMRPGDYNGDDRLTAITADERHVRVSIVGTPEQLLAFGLRFVALAEELARLAYALEDDLEVLALAAGDDGTGEEVPY